MIDPPSETGGQAVCWRDNVRQLLPGLDSSPHHTAARATARLMTTIAARRSSPADAAFYSFGMPFEPLREAKPADDDYTAASSSSSNLAADAAFYSFDMPFEPLEDDTAVVTAPEPAPAAATMSSCANSAAPDAAFYSFGMPFEPLRDDDDETTAVAPPAIASVDPGAANSAAPDAAFYSFGMPFESLSEVQPAAQEDPTTVLEEPDSAGMRKVQSEVFELVSDPGVGKPATIAAKESGPDAGWVPLATAAGLQQTNMGALF
jgi:hypothetical protein